MLNPLGNKEHRAIYFDSWNMTGYSAKHTPGEKFLRGTGNLILGFLRGCTLGLAEIAVCWVKDPDKVSQISQVKELKSHMVTLAEKSGVCKGLQFNNTSKVKIGNTTYGVLKVSEVKTSDVKDEDNDGFYYLKSDNTLRYFVDKTHYIEVAFEPPQTFRRTASFRIAEEAKEIVKQYADKLTKEPKYLVTYEGISNVFPYLGMKVDVDLPNLPLLKGKYEVAKVGDRKVLNDPFKVDQSYVFFPGDLRLGYYGENSYVMCTLQKVAILTIKNGKADGEVPLDSLEKGEVVLFGKQRCEIVQATGTIPTTEPDGTCKLTKKNGKDYLNIAQAKFYNQFEVKL